MTDLNGAAYAARDLRVCPANHLTGFRRAVRDLIAAGVKPTAKAIGAVYPALGVRDYGGGYTLPSGKYGAARRDELRRAGYVYGPNGRWSRP